MPIPKPGNVLKPSPIGIGIEVLVRVDRKVKVCELGKPIKVKKDFPKKNRDKSTLLTPKRKRQRPCKGGKPKVEYKEDKPREIGTFTLPARSKLWTKPLPSQSRVLKATKRVAERAGFTVTNEGERVFSRLDAPRTALEKVRYYLELPQGGGECFYRVYHVRLRRHCTCPDGSRCRSTTK